MSRLLAPALLLMSLSLAAGPPAPEPRSGGCGGAHVVVRGDTLYSIARRCHSSVVAIAAASRLADPRRIEVGQELIVPGPDVPHPFGVRKPEPVFEAPPMPGLPLVYDFQPGDTLYSLARWARTSVPALLATNPGLNPHKIEIGDEIRLPAGAVAPDVGRRREFGTGPGPALVRPELLRHIPAPAPPRIEPEHHTLPMPPPRIAPEHRRPAPPPRHDKLDNDEQRAPEGM
jgi:LysM repeat protein